MYSSGAATKGQLLPIETIVQAIDSQFIALRGTTGLEICQLVLIQNQRFSNTSKYEGYSKTLKTSPATSGDAQHIILG